MSSILVDVVAPGSSANIQDIQKSAQVLADFGFKLRIPPRLLKPHLYLSNSDEARFRFLKNAFENSDSEIIWCMRGGYGSNRLMPMLEKMKRPKKKKLFIGISDVTSIHSFLNQEWGWPTLHACLLDRIGKGTIREHDLKTIVQVIRGQKKVLSYKMKPLNTFAKKSDHLEGYLRGGNLVTFQSLLGTSAHPRLGGRILFLEELSERAYRIDRILQHLSQSGVLRSLRGVVFGQFTDCVERDGKIIWPKTLKEWAQQQNFPVWQGLPCGHDVAQRPLFLNTHTEIKGNTLYNFVGGKS